MASSEHPQQPLPTSPPWSDRLKLVTGILLIVAFVLIAYKARIVFIPLIIGGIIAYLIHPIARQVSAETKLPHGWATAFVFIILLATLVPISLLIAPLLIDQVQGLQAALLSLLEDIQANSTDVIVIAPGIELQVAELVTEVGTSLRELITGIAVKSPTILLGASKTLLMTIITLFISFYMTADSKKIVAWLHFIAPPGYRADVQMLLSEINGIWSDFFRGQVLVAIVAAILNTIIAFAIGLPEPLLMGLLAGVLEFLVSVGHTIWLIIALVLALTQGSTYLPVSPLVFALIVIGTNLLFTKLDLNFVIPRIVGERMHLHPMVVLIGIVVGASVGGVLGIALAAPAIASLRVLGRYIRAKLFDLDPYSEMREVAPVPDAARARRGRRKADESPPAPSEAK